MERNGNQDMSMICEHTECNQPIDGINVAHSAVAVLQKVTPDSYTFYQCEDGQLYQGVTYQHFCCNVQHMLNNFSKCIGGHYREELLHPIPPGGGSTNMHKQVLAEKLTCKVCQAPLDTVAYRFCLTICTPVNIVPDDSQNHLNEWCCSLNHAQQSALTTIGGINGTRYTTQM